MKILYTALKYDYGDPARGYSFEHYNFYDALIKMEGGKHEILYFPFDEIGASLGREGLNKKMLEVVRSEKPDLCFFFLFEHEFDFETINEITQNSGSKTFAWFSDDQWRFQNYSKHYAPCFHWISTTDKRAVEKYRKIGVYNVIKSQWACNHYLYHPKDRVNIGQPVRNEITFVGQPHGNRKQVIRALEKRHLPVVCYGNGWPQGRISQEEMIEVFECSKINLNLTKASAVRRMPNFVYVFLHKENGVIKLRSWKKIWEDLRFSFRKTQEQIKGRNFEVPGCGGFLLTGYAEDLEKYYVEGKEVVVFRGIKDLAKKAYYYSTHEEERKQIARAGFERTVKDHTYEKRFQEIFHIMGLE
ncbi:hypothetical protein A3E97_05420 [Candidatus Uhrbacteria bacterium RIFCSPHIGHO2_12_FULL_47_12]|uniref:Spore protein YkvP/CgeB glycosyl transferase-like domain-containing protein n=1 Tax=Candidatus Uhrbacteria bacterium RIFCSPLOWO2_02_FULL_48_18 TaxID=1802408 RepID=A0A1F7V935_9BACT|nr:MAG: hypothetical protein A2839_03670 [Candidatus Uhrbacteria bacterium RIFCSPHIGHO2_01_FULL_47_10]OGL77207.1 MAG: hypothetical protein A3E97_05420 [Candidatus Uhrbacteria bacterium RIFCSPHIGHO2_12_FULL_47_12]OGL81873.1 MAG: hypothetical protein A3B20_02165 [Candidatus Uhrbacteria bacterium RIFCSPLOWO2_01_FULL_47_17]OGL87036.1 MAG: hypothetical protein A3I41_03755 [Candidatus Uhrbacteria bacterium RIFCSPLOWO2_02_FULL_48_18]OGL92750.1 MAG: hypothetical protein A3H12_03740 [Candidatus Uhrbacte